MNASPSKIALMIATEAKSIGDTNLIDTIVDAGFYEAPRDSCDGLCTEAFDTLVEEVAEAMPFARYDSRIAREWARAGSDNLAAERSEQIAFGSDGWRSW